MAVSVTAAPAVRENPLKPIYDACNAGDSKAKFAALPDFPRLIDLEPTNACTFRCLMCPTGNKSMSRKTGFMDMTIYRSIVEQLAPHGSAIRFIQWGEPLMHPHILEMVKLAHDAGLLTHLNTNGNDLDAEMAEALMAAGLDSLKFSFQGVDRKSYKEMRGIDFFDGLMEKARMFHALRGDRVLPFFHISTTITYETPEQVAKFKEDVAPYVDLVSIGRTVLDTVDIGKVRLRPAELAMLKWLKEQESVIKVHPECPEVFDKLSVNWDGTITACCGDADNKMLLGSVADTAIVDLWNCEKMNYYRGMLADMRHDELELCSKCYDYQAVQKPGVQNL
jgi:MoaA/NifB/PqqE/SkfB family radical SAM enzyme